MLTACDQTRGELSDTQSLLNDRNGAVKQLEKCAGQIAALKASHDAHMQSVGK